MKIPFSVYDFFGYLAVGFLVLVSLDYSSGGGWLLKDTIAPIYVLLWVVIAYIVGHIVAHIASSLLEHLFLRKFLGSPEEHLFGDSTRTWKTKLFPATFKPFPKATQERILARAVECRAPKSGRALFFHCHAIVKHQAVTRDRMNIFLALYGFCRNTSMASTLAACSLIVSHILFPSTAPDLIPWLPATLVVAVGMLYRYLKFFRHYTTEVFVSYADASPAAVNPKV
jgi:hypothetical protein